RSTMRGKTKTRGFIRPTWCRVLALLLIISTVVGSIPERAFAKATTNDDGTETTYTQDDYEIIYKEVNTWENYANINITIKNTGKEIIDNWEIQCEYDAEISNIWSAEIGSSEDKNYSIIAKEDNASIPVGGSVSFGFTGLGENAKPVAPSDMTLICDKDRTENDDDEPGTPGGSNPGTNIVLPEEWSGLGYALYAGGSQNLSLYTYKTSITGDVHTNKDFYYQGTSLEITGELEACGAITTNTSSQEGSLQIGKKEENATSIDMPDITKEVYEHIKDTAKVYDSNKTFESNRVAIINPIYVNGRTTFNATEFLGKGIIYSEDSITYNVGSVSTPDDSRILLCAENGDITLNGSEINMNAILYAPNGTVYVIANNLNLNEKIIEKQV
ncbi:cellulose binding domain-containing protein, partial [Anaerosporobacter sp.]